MELVRVETIEHRAMVKDLSSEYLTILIKKYKEHYGFEINLAELPAYLDAYMENDFNKFLAPHGYFFLALVNGQPVGMGGLQKVSDDTSEIKRMYVKSSSRGKKIGKAILNKLLDVAKLDGYRTVILDTFDFWEVAPKFYRSMGFVETEPNPNAEPPPELIQHCIFMKLQLT